MILLSRTELGKAMAEAVLGETEKPMKSSAGRTDLSPIRPGKGDENKIPHEETSFNIIIELK